MIAIMLSFSFCLILLFLPVKSIYNFFEVRIHFSKQFSFLQIYREFHLILSIISALNIVLSTIVKICRFFFSYYLYFNCLKTSNYQVTRSIDYQVLLNPQTSTLVIILFVLLIQIDNNFLMTINN